MAQILRMRTAWTGVQGTPLLSTHYFTRVDSSSAASAADAVAALWSGMEDYIDNALSWSVEPFVGVIDSATGALVGVDNTAGGNAGDGASSSETLPFASQGLLTLATGAVVNGRILKGRTFIPGPCEGNNDHGVPDATYKSALSAAATAMLTTPDAELLVWSRAHGVAHPVTTFDPWDQWAVLRSRRD